MERRISDETGSDASSFQDAGRTDYAGTGVLWENEENLARYNDDVVTLVSAGLRQGLDILEFGAGIATLAEIWRSRFGVRPSCLEIDESQREQIIRRGFRCYASIEEINQRFDGIYTSNVLEHIEDDVLVLNQLREALNPGGTLSIYVPAFMHLYSPMDAAIGHYRRYEKKELVSKVQGAGFEVEICHYADSIGFFAWLWMKHQSRDASVGLASAKSLRFYDRVIYPISRFADRLGFKHLFGKNLLLIARRPR